MMTSTKRATAVRGRNAAGSRIDIVRQKEARQNIDEAEKDRIHQGLTKAFSQLQGRRYGKGDEGTDDQDADDADGYGNCRRNQHRKNIVDQLL